jgi:hypothetical protein
MKINIILILLSLLCISCSKDNDNILQNIESLSLEKNFGTEEEIIQLISKDFNFKNYTNYSIKIGDYDVLF